MIHPEDKRALAHITIVYSAVAVILALLLGGCAVVVKQGNTPPVDPLTRKHYPTIGATQ